MREIEAVSFRGAGHVTYELCHWIDNHTFHSARAFPLLSSSLDKRLVLLHQKLIELN